jgi:Tol biopolymer transport system component
MMAKATPALLLIALSFSASVGCKNAKPATKNSIDTGLATINLSAVTKSNQTQTFREVTRASLLPKAVLDQFGGMADPGETSIITDVVDPQQLVVAAVSEQYCIVSYWQGVSPQATVITRYFETEIFELSGGSATLVWISHSQGGLNFRDLKEMVESGRMHNDLGSGEIDGIAISPDGKTMAVAYMKGNTAFIYKIDMETGIASRLTDATTGEESSPAFSADGKLFAYSYVSDHTNPRIIEMNADGSNPRYLPGSGTANLYPTFSPDGQTVYFGRSVGFRPSQPPPAVHQWDIFSVGADGSDVRQVTHEGFVHISQPCVSSDGKKLLVATLGLDTPERMEIYLLDHPEKPSQVLSPIVPHQAPGPIFAYPNFMPDGRSILFLAASNRIVSYDYDVYRLGLASGAIERLTKGIGYASDLKVFADGKTAVVLKWRSDWQGTAVKSEFYLLDLQSHKLTPFKVTGMN